MRGRCLLTCLLVASCGHVDSPAPDAPEPPDPPPPPPQVTLKVTLNWLDDSGQITATEDITSLAVRDVAVLLPNAAARGGFDTRTAEMTTTGLAIRDVPANTTYTLDVPSLAGRLLYVTDARDIDLKFYEVGRHNPLQPTRPTPLTVNANTMTAWQDGDGLTFYCARVNAFGPVAAMQPGVSGWPKVGDTTLALTVDWANIDRGIFQDRMTPLIDGNVGDRLVLSHDRRLGSSTGYPYNTSLETAAFPSFTQTDGAARTVAAAFSTTPQDAVHLKLQLPEFVRYATDIHPDAKINPDFLAGGGVTIRTQPADPAHKRQFSALAPSMVFTLFGAVNVDIDMGQMVYPHVPSSWSQWLGAAHTFIVDRDTPFGIPHRASAVIGTTLPITPGSPATDVVTPVVPRISPPRAATLGGVALSAPHLGLYQPSGPPIEVRWEEPALVDATPTSYSLTLIKLDQSGDKLVPSTLAAIAAPAKSRALSIPWQLFPGTGVYYVVLTAIAAEGEFDPQLGGPSGTDSVADAVSGILTLK
ncbi:MAG TPA: hypothetical protein VGD80_38630 [Kofleriaceae bacterium]